MLTIVEIILIVTSPSHIIINQLIPVALFRRAVLFDLQLSVDH